MVFCLRQARARENGAPDESRHGRAAPCGAAWTTFEAEGKDGLSRSEFSRLAENGREKFGARRRTLESADAHLWPENALRVRSLHDRVSE